MDKERNTRQLYRAVEAIQRLSAEGMKGEMPGDINQICYSLIARNAGRLRCCIDCISESREGR